MSGTESNSSKSSHSSKSSKKSKHRSERTSKSTDGPVSQPGTSSKDPSEGLASTMSKEPIQKLIIRSVPDAPANPQLDMVVAALQSTNQQMAAMVSAIGSLESKQPKKRIASSERKIIIVVHMMISYP